MTPDAWGEVCQRWVFEVQSQTQRTSFGAVMSRITRSEDSSYIRVVCFLYNHHEASKSVR
jgi:hypothetical protein